MGRRSKYSAEFKQDYTSSQWASEIYFELIKDKKKPNPLAEVRHPEFCLFP
jgi:hypothetical protein